jgi:hypothetical protein
MMNIVYVTASLPYGPSEAFFCRDSQKYREKDMKVQ